LALDALHREEEQASGGVAQALPFEAHAEIETLRSTQAAVGVILDPQHFEFLRHADGWNRFAGNIDLFGTSDLLGSSRFKQAEEWIRLMDRRVLGSYAKERGKLFPIGKSSVSTDLLLMINEGGQLQPKVLWFTNELIEEFANFDEMFVSFKAYRRQVIDYWLEQNPSSAP